MATKSISRRPSKKSSKQPKSGISLAYRPANKKYPGILEAADKIYAAISDPMYGGIDADRLDEEMTNGPYPEKAPLDLYSYEIGLKFLLSIRAIKYEKKTNLLKVDVSRDSR